MVLLAFLDGLDPSDLLEFYYLGHITSITRTRIHLVISATPAIVMLHEADSCYAPKQIPIFMRREADVYLLRSDADAYLLRPEVNDCFL